MEAPRDFLFKLVNLILNFLFGKYPNANHLEFLKGGIFKNCKRHIVHEGKGMNKKDYNKIRLDNYLEGKNKKLDLWERLYLNILGVYPWLDKEK